MGSDKRRMYWVKLSAGYNKYDKNGHFEEEVIYKRPWNKKSDASLFCKVYSKEWALYFYKLFHDELIDFMNKYWQTGKYLGNNINIREKTDANGL